MRRSTRTLALMALVLAAGVAGVAGMERPPPPYPENDAWRAQWGSGRGGYAGDTYTKTADGRWEVADPRVVLKPTEKKQPRPQEKKPQAKTVVLKTRDQAPPLTCSVSDQMFAGVFASD